MNPGNYLLTVFSPVDNKTYKFNVKVLSVISGEDLVKYYMNGSQYVVSVLDGDGSPLVGSVVTFNINGVFYTNLTDENGFATLNINLKPGKYIVTAIAANGLHISNSITVLPILEIIDYNNTSDSTFDDESSIVSNGNEEFIVGTIAMKETGNPIFIVLLLMVFCLGGLRIKKIK